MTTTGACILTLWRRACVERVSNGDPKAREVQEQRVASSVLRKTGVRSVGRQTDLFTFCAPRFLTNLHAPGRPIDDKQQSADSSRLGTFDTVDFLTRHFRTRQVLSKAQ